MDCYFSVVDAEKMLPSIPFVTEQFAKHRLDDACREILRLNEVIERMGQESKMWQARSDARDARIRRFYKRYNHLNKEEKEIIDEMDSESYCENCGSLLRLSVPASGNARSVSDDNIAIFSYMADVACDLVCASFYLDNER